MSCFPDTKNYIEAQGVGKNNKEAENNAAKAILFDLLECSKLNDELIQKEEDNTNNLIKKLKLKANIDTELGKLTLN